MAERRLRRAHSPSGRRSARSPLADTSALIVPDPANFPRSGLLASCPYSIAKGCFPARTHHPGCGSIDKTMGNIDRRSFLAAGITAASSLNHLLAAPGRIAVDEVLRSGIAQRKIPAVVGMIASGSRTLHAGAFGRRDSSGVPVQVDSIFQIMSMTKAVTPVAALQLVDQGKVDLDEPVVRHLPQFEKLQVLEGFDTNGKPSLRPATTSPTLRHLLTHTSGLCYDIWDEAMFRYTSKNPESPAVPGPLIKRKRIVKG